MTTEKSQDYLLGLVRELVVKNVTRNRCRVSDLIGR